MPQSHFIPSGMFATALRTTGLMWYLDGNSFKELLNIGYILENLSSTVKKKGRKVQRERRKTERKEKKRKDETRQGKTRQERKQASQTDRQKEQKQENSLKRKGTKSRKQEDTSKETTDVYKESQL